MLSSEPPKTGPLFSLHTDAETAQAPQLVDRIDRALKGLQHGQLTIVVHDGQVVQIDRLVRVRHFRSSRRS